MKVFKFIRITLFQFLLINLSCMYTDESFFIPNVVCVFLFFLILLTGNQFLLFSEYSSLGFIIFVLQTEIVVSLFLWFSVLFCSLASIQILKMLHVCLRKMCLIVSSLDWAFNFCLKNLLLREIY